MEFCNWESWVPRGGIVVVKPNLCTSLTEIQDKANTSFSITEAACRILLTRTERVVICEADHMRQTTEAVYDATGYRALEKLGVELVNLSQLPMTAVECAPIKRIELPRLLLEADAFITVPKLKTHALTYFTASLKNQWGCVPRFADRFRYHGYIDEMLASLHRLLRPRMSLVDAIICMEGRGPVAGPARELGLVLAGEDSVAVDATCMRLVGLEPMRARHVVTAAQQNLGRIRADDIEIDGDFDGLQTRFQQAPRDWANTIMFKAMRFPWFTNHIYANDAIYRPIARLVKLVRRTGVLGG